MKKVEQIDINGKVGVDFDKKLKQKEIETILARHFEIIKNKNPYFCKLASKNFTLCVKQITYLGHPHPLFKKRIQIPTKWKEPLMDGALLMGIYSYKTNNIFVFFDTKKYKTNRLNNSSTHIHTIDLQKAMEYGIFEKMDSRENKIAVVRENKLEKYVKNLLSKNKNELQNEIKLFDNFSSSLPIKWGGKECYTEMFDANYKNKAQAEWPGFYLEFKFENFLNENLKFKKICRFVSKKKKDNLDFDLEFLNGYLGDLKMHSEKSNSILGNDKINFLEAINLHKKFWYIVYYHKTKMDKDYKNVVTRYWNKLLNKEDSLSYATRMKYFIQLSNVKILEINKYNLKHISDMSQGRNSNSKERKMKIQIKKKDIDNFIIFNKRLG